MSLRGEIIYVNSGFVTRKDIGNSADVTLSLTDPEYIKYLHDRLQEWIENSNGTGYFVIRNKTAFVEEQNHD